MNKYNRSQKYPFLSTIRLSILDSLSPFSSWVARILFRGHWVSTISHKIVRGWESPFRRRERLHNQWLTIHQPENWMQTVMLTFGIVFLPQLLITLWFISPFCSQTTDYGWQDNNLISLLGTTWQVTAGLIGITFVIVIFLVETANRDKYERRALPVFFSETWLLFTASFGILVIMSMGFTSFIIYAFNFRTDYLSYLFSWQWVLFVANTGLILNIFIRTVRVLPKSYFTKIIKEFNHRLASLFVELELTERVASNLSITHIKKLGISFSIFEPDPIPGKVIVTIPDLPRQIQRITDINLKLVEIAYSHAKQLLPNINESDFVLYAGVDHRIANEKPGIAMINPIINHPSVTSYLKRSIKYNSYSRITRSSLNEELVLNRDMILRAVQNQEEETVEDLLNHYIDLIEAFLQATDSYGIHFDKKTASKEMNLFSGWKLVSVIIDKYRSLVPSFLALNDFEMVMHFLHFPRDLMEMAIIYKDHLIYQQFVGLYNLIYFKCREIENSKQKENIIDYFFHLLIDHRRFTLIPRLEKQINDEQQLMEYKDYYEDLLVNWNRLLKQALDNKSSNRFSEFAHEVKKLIHEFYPNVDGFYIENLNFRIENASSPEQKEVLLKELPIFNFILKSKLELEKLKQSMFLGLGGWLIHQVENGRISQDDYFNLIPTVHQFFMDFEQLYQDYLNNKGFENAEDLFNWNSWEMSEWPTEYGEVISGSLTYDSWLEKYFILRSLEILGHQVIPLASIPASYQSKEIYDSIEKKVKDIIKNNIWAEVLHKANIDRVEDRVSTFIEILKDAKNKQQIVEEEDVQESLLDDELIIAFQNGVINSWGKMARIRQLVQMFGRYQEIFDEGINKTIPKFGIFELAPKEAFIKQNRIAYPGWGESYGRGLAEFEDKFLGSQLCITEPISENSETLIDVTANQLKEMVEIGLNPIIFINGREISKIIKEAPQFIPPWRLQSNPLGEISVWGLFNNFPIIYNKGIPQNTIFLVDINLFGVLTQYLSNNNDSQPLSINIDLMSKEQVNNIIDKKPDWLIDAIKGMEENREIMERCILQNVNLQIAEYCRFEELNPKAIRSFCLSLDKGKVQDQEDLEEDEQYY